MYVSMYRYAKSVVYASTCTYICNDRKYCRFICSHGHDFELKRNYLEIISKHKKFSDEQLCLKLRHEI